MVLQVSRINQKLRQLHEYISHVTRYRSESKSEYTGPTTVELASERAIEKACECALDIGNMLIANLGLKSPGMYSYIPVILARAEIISKDLEERMIKMAGFRNRLVHEYASLKPERIYKIVHEDIDDLVEFARQIAEFVEKRVKEENT